MKDWKTSFHLHTDIITWWQRNSDRQSSHSRSSSLQNKTKLETIILKSFVALIQRILSHKIVT